MLTCQLATPEQRKQFLPILRAEMSDYLERTFQLMGMTWNQFVELYYSTGQVFVVFQNSELAGYYWIEVKAEILHLHGIVILPGFRGIGIGTSVLRNLAEEYASRVRAIELGVQDDNLQAKSLYEREGFKIIKSLSDLKFTIMQKPLLLEEHRL